MRRSAALLALPLAACAAQGYATGDAPGAQEVQQALSVCAGKPVVKEAQCRATDDATEFSCDYRLRDASLEGVPQQTVIAADGDKFVLIDIPNHCKMQ